MNISVQEVHKERNIIEGAAFNTKASYVTCTRNMIKCADYTFIAFNTHVLSGLLPFENRFSPWE